jgi:putative molybdopterin biosynthesis protein
MIETRLGELRKLRGVGASELARRVGVSRQTIHAIEAGSFVPNTEVALKLARELEVKVEELFALREDEGGPAPTVAAEMLTTRPVEKGQAVRVAQVGDRRVAIAVDAVPYYLPEADGVVAGVKKGKVDVAAFAPEEGLGKKVVLAGCDPAIGMLVKMVEKLSGVEVCPVGASSRTALEWLVEGKVHIAGTHLEDEATGEFNLPYLKRVYGREDLAVVSFARWEEGLVVGRGNPKGIRKVEDVARRGVRFVNREAGSGARALMEKMMAKAGVPEAKVNGYERVGYGHLEVAYRVMTGEADVCVATRAAAQTFGLDFVAVQSERYDFVMRRETMGAAAAQAFLDVLQRASLRRKLEVLAGYDTAQTGAVLA